MRRLLLGTVLLVALLTPVLAGSAVKKEDFVIRASVVPGKINSWVFVKGGKPAYNVTLKFVNVPDGINLREDPVKIIPCIPPAGTEKVVWKAIVDENKSYNLTNAIEVVSWDNSVSLSAFLIKNNETTNETIVTNESEVLVYGKTDGEEFCEQMKRLPGQENNSLWEREDVCRVKIIINGGEPFYANSSGLFAGKAKLTKHGINEINVTAIDAGGNTNTVILKANYTGAGIALTQSEDILLVILALFGLVIAAAVIGGLVFFFIKKKPRKVEEKKEKVEFAETEKKEVKPSKPVKELKRKPKTLKELKERKAEIKKRMDELEKKDVLTTSEKEEKVRLQNELDEIVDKLLANDEYLFELEERAFKALVDAREGKPSKQIKEELVNEGYTPREISKIREFFVRGKK